MLRQYTNKEFKKVTGSRQWKSYTRYFNINGLGLIKMYTQIETLKIRLKKEKQS